VVKNGWVVFMNKIQNTLLKILFLLTPFYVVNAQEKNEDNKPFTSLGYNAIQASIKLPQSERFRLYNNLDFNLPSDLELKIKTMNEVGEKYLGGWNTISITKKSSNAELLYVNRAGGVDNKNIEIYSYGFGLRTQLYGVLPAEIYGFIDAVIWTNKNQNAKWLGDGEIFTFVGKEFNDWTIEMLNVFRPNGNNYAELELFGPKIENAIGNFRPFSRIEVSNYDLEKVNVIVGIQYTVN
jgi:hypothetical protein